MSHDGRILQQADRVDFVGAFRPDDVPTACCLLNSYLLGEPRQIFLNFGECLSAFPNSMLPLITMCSRLRHLGYSFCTLLPKANSAKKRFLDYNWAHYLSPEHYRLSDDYSDRHLAVQQYSTDSELNRILNRILDLVMRTVQVPRSAITSLEWSLAEIMDNVLNHAQSLVGGYVQLAVFPPSKKLAFTVADAGRGILESLRESIPNLGSDRVAIETAVRAGVTRNKEFGQGNGLSGSLALATQTGGWFRIRTGQSEIVWMPPNPDYSIFEANSEERFPGTVVDVQLPYGTEVDVGAILTAASSIQRYGPVTYSPVDLIEMKHLTEDTKAVMLQMRDETTGFGSRSTGQQMRNKALNLLRAEQQLPLVIDWDGVQVIASSYADEFIGKLFVEIGPIGFMTRIRMINLAPVVQTLVNKAILQRTRQG